MSYICDICAGNIPLIFCEEIMYQLQKYLEHKQPLSQVKNELLIWERFQRGYTLAVLVRWGSMDENITETFNRN